MQPHWRKDYDNPLPSTTLAPLAPLLQRRGLQQIERPADRVELATYKGGLFKDGCWRWPEPNLAGNAPDFFVKFLGLSFHDAMRQITGAQISTANHWRRSITTPVRHFDR